MYLFSYGSNNPEQLKKRLQYENDIEAIPAHLNDFVRVFGGYSEKWNGAVASIVPCKGRRVNGILTAVTSKDLDILDKYEVGYKRYNIQVTNRVTMKHQYAVVYIKVDDIDYTYPPSNDYILAISKTMSNIKYIKKTYIPIYIYERYLKKIKLHDTIILSSITT